MTPRVRIESRRLPDGAPNGLDRRGRTIAEDPEETT
jgi:hypothetical protein